MGNEIRNLVSQSNKFMFIVYACLCEIRIYLFCLFNFAKIPDNNKYSKLRGVPVYYIFLEASSTHVSYLLGPVAH